MPATAENIQTWWMNFGDAGIEVGMKRTLSLAFPALALLLAASVPVLRAADIPAEGSMAPDFTLKSQEGKTVSLKDFRGQWVVLYFYPKDMTPGLHDRSAQFPARSGSVHGEKGGHPGRQRR